MRRPGVTLWVLGLVALALAPPAAAAPRLPAAATQTAPADVKVIAQGGFGDVRNAYAWAMARFRGKLYVGTGRSVACVENFTVDFYLRVSGRYISEPFPGAYCPPDPYDMDLRAEIWEYTPSSGRWRLAFRSPADVPNPRARGKYVARDIAFRGMAVYRDGRGRKRLYIGGLTSDEYIPELKLKHPPRILSTTDGIHFRATPARKVLVRMPYGDYRPMGFRSMRVWRGKLFVTAIPGLTGDGAIFEVTRPWSPRRARFRQVSPKTMAVFETDVFDGSLWAGTGDREQGYGVYRIDEAKGKYRARPIVTGGAGRGQTATSVVSMHVFKDRIYVGSSGWYNAEENPVSELIRIDREGGWQVVAGPSRVVGSQVRWPISGLGDGFNNIFAGHFWRMATHRGRLVVGTNDWAYLVPLAYAGLDQATIDLLDTAFRPEFGFDLWGSCNGDDWTPITSDAFATRGPDFGARTLVDSPSGLYIGSANHSQGLKVWKYTGPPCPKPAGTPAATAARSLPRDAVRLTRPPALPTGFPSEGRLPLVAGGGGHD